MAISRIETAFEFDVDEGILPVCEITDDDFKGFPNKQRFEELLWQSGLQRKANQRPLDHGFSGRLTIGTGQAHIPQK